MIVYCQECEFEFRIKKKGVYRCPLCNSSLEIIEKNDEKQLKDSCVNEFEKIDKEKNFNKYINRVDEKQIDELIEKEALIVEKAKKGKSGLVSWVKTFYEVLKNPSAEWQYKLIAGAAILYVFTPVDLVPDFLVGVGLLDDASMAAFAATMLGEAVKNYSVPEEEQIKKGSGKKLYFKVLDDNQVIDYNYEEKRETALLTLKKSDVKKLGYTNNKNMQFSSEEVYLTHPYFNKVLMESSTYKNTLMEDAWDENLRVFAGLGAKEITWSGLEATHESKDGSVNLKVINKIGNIEGSGENRQCKYKKLSGSKKFSDIGEIHEEFIDDLIWVFTRNREGYDSIKERILQGLREMELEFEVKSDDFKAISLQGDVQGKVSFSMKAKKETAVYRKIKYKVEFNPLPKEIEEDRKGFYDKIQKKLDERLALLEGAI